MKKQISLEVEIRLLSDHKIPSCGFPKIINFFAGFMKKGNWIQTNRFRSTSKLGLKNIRLLHYGNWRVILPESGITKKIRILSKIQRRRMEGMIPNIPSFTATKLLRLLKKLLKFLRRMIFFPNQVRQKVFKEIDPLVNRQAPSGIINETFQSSQQRCFFGFCSPAFY